MYYTEEELLEAVDILIEDYGFEEDYAIELIVESYEEELLNERFKFDRNNQPTKPLTAKHKRELYSDYSLYSKDDPEERQEMHDTLRKEVAERALFNRTPNLHKHHNITEKDKERLSKTLFRGKTDRLEDKLEEYKNRQNGNKKEDNKSTETTTNSHKEEPREAYKVPEQPKEQPKEQSKEEESKQAYKVPEEKVNKSRLSNKKIIGGAATVAAGGAVAYTLYKIHKAKEALKNKKRRGRI